jgi:prepilin-type N-terminal cleavage/methylation domain-containing protein
VRSLRGSGGFTLVEILIVVIIMGILAAVAIPRMVNVSDDARASVLDRNLSAISRATELYYHQHRETWPGAVTSTGGVAVSTAIEAQRSFERQLLFPTNADGVYTLTRGAAAPFGPYLKSGIPENPYNNSSVVYVDYTTTDINHNRTYGTTGWKFYAKTGVLLPNHEASITGGIPDEAPIDVIDP